MNVIRANVLGFCMGVRRAVELAAGEARRAAETGSPVYTLGPLIHNPRVLNDLKEKGVEAVEALPPECEKCTVIIRAHGISLEKENDLRDTGCKIVDATCPRVKASQLKTKELTRAGYCIFLAGEASHAEIEGVFGYAKDAKFSAIVNSAQDAKEAAIRLFQIDGNAKTALLGQTTISEALYNDIGSAIKKHFSNLEIINTICAAATERQNALRDLLRKTDAVIIAGGKNSANTLHLLEIAEESGKPCALAEDAKDIPPGFFNYKTIGLCAGASTPDSVIDEIEAALKG